MVEENVLGSFEVREKGLGTAKEIITPILLEDALELLTVFKEEHNPLGIGGAVEAEKAAVLV